MNPINISRGWGVAAALVAATLAGTVTAGAAAGAASTAPAPGTITGRVLPAKNAASSPAVFVSLDRPGRNDASPVTLSDGKIADSNGDYTIGSVPPGRYLVEFGWSSNPYRNDASTFYPGSADPGHATWVTVHAGQTVRLKTTVAYDSGLLEGRVINLAGLPATNAVVTATMREPDGSEYQPDEAGFGGTDAHGRWGIDGVPPGRWQVDARVAGRTFATRSVQVADGQAQAGIDFTWPQPARTRLLSRSASIRAETLAVSARINDRARVPVAVRLLAHVGGRTETVASGSTTAVGGTIRPRIRLPRPFASTTSGTVVLSVPATRVFTRRVFRFPAPTAAVVDCLDVWQAQGDWMGPVRVDNMGCAAARRAIDAGTIDQTGRLHTAGFRCHAKPRDSEPPVLDASDRCVSGRHWFRFQWRSISSDY